MLMLLFGLGHYQAYAFALFACVSIGVPSRLPDNVACSLRFRLVHGSRTSLRVEKKGKKESGYHAHLFILYFPSKNLCPTQHLQHLYLICALLANFLSQQHHDVAL